MARTGTAPVRNMTDNRNKTVSERSTLPLSVSTPCLEEPNNPDVAIVQSKGSVIECRTSETSSL